MRTNRTKTFMVILISPLLAGLVLMGLIGVTLTGGKLIDPASAHAAGVVPSTGATDFDAAAAPALRPSLRISIPYGFAASFPIRANGQDVLVEGHGSCTGGESFTVAVTVTHDATGNMARGELTEACAGETIRQEWQLTAVAVGDALPLGLAESCGLVQTKDGGAITDEQEWCVDVYLGDYLFLPMITNEE
jgi:hypothetical protein